MNKFNKLTNKELKEQKALNMKDLCSAVKKDFEENFLKEI